MICTINLETLMVMAYNLKLKDTPFRGIHDLPVPIAPEIPFIQIRRRWTGQK